MSSTSTIPSGDSSAEPIIGAGIDEPIVETPTTDVVDEPAIDTPESEATPQGETETEGDGRRLPQSIRSLKESAPDAYKAAKGAFFENLAWRQEFPNIQAARQANDLIKSVGGKEGVSQLREDAGVFKTAAQQFLKGDPAFVKDLWEEDPIAAALHVQPMLDTFRERDMEGFKSTIAKLWVKDLNDVGFENGLNLLKGFISKGDKDSALKVLGDFYGWHKGIDTLASRTEDPRVKSLLAERAKLHDTREQTEHHEFLKTYRTETINTLSTEAGKVFDSFFKGRKIEEDDRRDLLLDALKIANRAVEADTAFMQERDKFLQQGDSHSARRATIARYNRELPDAVKRVARRYGMASGAPPANKQQTISKPGTSTSTPTGWVAVNARPQPSEIDRSRTGDGMILSGRAILRNGKKVDWSQLKKSAV